MVLRLIISDELYHRLPYCDEGDLTRRLASLVSQRSLAAAASTLELAEYVLLGRGAETTGDRYSEGVQGDVMESVIAPFTSTPATTRPGVSCWPPSRNPSTQRVKSAGVPITQKPSCRSCCRVAANRTPTYRVVASSGPAHRPEFTVEVATAAEVLASARAAAKTPLKPKRRGRRWLY